MSCGCSLEIYSPNKPGSGGTTKKPTSTSTSSPKNDQTISNPGGCWDIRTTQSLSPREAIRTIHGPILAESLLDIDVQNPTLHRLSVQGLCSNPSHSASSSSSLISLRHPMTSVLITQVIFSSVTLISTHYKIQTHTTPNPDLVPNPEWPNWSSGFLDIPKPSPSGVWVWTRRPQIGPSGLVV